MNGESLVISYNDTVVAWTETAAGTKSREIMLGKNAVQNAISRKFEIISPVEGTWANRQPLVLDCAPETEVYYSFSGYDPLEFGFAYDGPVLIDLNGNITLNLVAVHGDGSITRKTVSYIVNEPVAVKPPLYLSALNPLVICGVENLFNFSNLTYGIGSHLDASYEGELCIKHFRLVNVRFRLKLQAVLRFIVT